MAAPPRPAPPSEWFFRSSLDRYIWVYGMACAMVHPMVSCVAPGLWRDGRSWGSAPCGSDVEEPATPVANHPFSAARPDPLVLQASKALMAIDEMPAARRWTVRAAVVAATAVAFGFYYQHIYILPKVEYNKVGPLRSSKGEGLCAGGAWAIWTRYPSVAT